MEQTTTQTTTTAPAWTPIDKPDDGPESPEAIASADRLDQIDHATAGYIGAVRAHSQNPTPWTAETVNDHLQNVIQLGGLHAAENAIRKATRRTGRRN